MSGTDASRVRASILIFTFPPIRRWPRFATRRSTRTSIGSIRRRPSIRLSRKWCSSPSRASAESVTAMRLAMLGLRDRWPSSRLRCCSSASGLPTHRLALYLWHPLPVWEFACGAHVDAVVIAMSLLAHHCRDVEQAMPFGRAPRRGGADEIPAHRHRAGSLSALGLAHAGGLHRRRRLLLCALS